MPCKQEPAKKSWQKQFGKLVYMPACPLPSMGSTLHCRSSMRMRLELRYANCGARMKVKRVIANFAARNPEDARVFYQDILGLDLLMDHGWIRTYGSDAQMAVQVSFASEGGSGTPVPDLSIEVDDLDGVYRQMKDAGFAIEYGPAGEP